MASRKTWAQIGQQTIEILERGWYTLPDGTTSSLGDSVRQAVQRSRRYAPDDFADVFARRDQLLAAIQNPGDGFLNASQAQEESLARASGRYSCISPMAGYYATNRSCSSCLYTDNMIYSPAVPVIRDDDHQLLAAQYPVSMITAPAVNAGTVRTNEPHNESQIEPTMLGRIEKMLSLAVIHGHRRLVLGAWGCGVFKNDPADVARWFHFHLYSFPASAGVSGLISSSSFPVPSFSRLGSGLNDPDEEFPKTRSY